jgi:hypothetical protein
LQLQLNRIGYDGELATAQELNQLMRHGYYVFHDLQAENFNIDHIVIGPAGVFAVETKSRSNDIGRRFVISLRIKHPLSLKNRYNLHDI